MAEIPQYEAGVAFQPAPVVSSAPLGEEVARLGSKMTQVFGTEALKDEEIKLMADRYSGASIISDASTKAFIKASKNPNVAHGMQEYNAAMDGVGQEIKANSEKRNIPYLNRMLSYHTNKVNLEFARQESQQSKSLAYVHFSKDFGVSTNEMSNDNFNGNQKNGQALYGKAQRMINTGLSSGYLTPDRTAVFQKTLDNEFHQSVTLGQYRKARIDGTQKDFRKKFMEGKEYNRVFDLADKERMLHQFDNIDKQFAAENGVTLNTYDLYKKQLLFDAQNGRALDQGMLANLVATKPKEAPNLLNAVRNSEQQHQIVASTQNGTVTDIRTKINSLDDPNNVPANVNDAMNNHAASTQLKDYLKKLQNDPAQVIKSNPAYQAEAQKVKADGSLTPTQLNVAMQQHLGFPNEQIHALDNNTAIQAVEAIKGLDLQDQVGALDKFLDSHADSSRPYIIKDLQRAGLPLASQYLYRISKSTNPILQNMAVPAAVAWSHIQVNKGSADYTKAENAYSQMLQVKDTTKSDVEKILNDDKTYQNNANVYMSQGGDIAQAFNNYKNHAELLTFQLMSQGEDVATAASNANQAMTSGLEYETYNTSTVAYDNTVNHSLLFGHRLLGKQYSPGVLDYLMDKVSTGKVNVPHNFKALFPLLPPKKLQAKYLENAHFVTLPDQSGLILQDNYLSPVKLKDDNEPITTRWTDLKNNNSKLMQEFLKKKSEWGYVKNELSKYNPWKISLEAMNLLKRGL